MAMKGMRFTDQELQFALTIRLKSRSAYDHISDVFSGLPSSRTLDDYARSMGTGDGKISAQALSRLNQIKSQDEHGLLVLDAMILRKGIYYNQRTCKIEGYAEQESIHEMLQGLCFCC